jgi:hypothetical protein
MAGYSARQSSYTTGDTITAAHSNDEFNQQLLQILIKIYLDLET